MNPTPSHKEPLGRLKHFLNLFWNPSSLSLRATGIAAIGIFITSHNVKREQYISIKRLTTERYSKAVDQLGSDKLQVRLGGIYTLEQISKEAPDNYWAIIEILTGFVRESSKSLEQKQDADKREAPVDIQAVATVLKARRNSYKNGEPDRLDLNKAYLNHAELWVANLEEANLEEALLMHALLGGAKLIKANLMKANLKEAFLMQANLEGASIVIANLEETYLKQANLRGADMEGANLKKANMKGTNLAAANLKNTCLVEAEGLTVAQIKKAKNWKLAYYSSTFRAQLGLPRDTSKYNTCDLFK